MKCPNCGSTAHIYDHEAFVWKDIVSVHLTYECDCGCRFVSRVEVNRSEEKFDGEIKEED